MSYDTDKVDEVVLALLYLGMRDGARAWKSLDWEDDESPPQKGLYFEPRR
jgi:hypothetical protein